MSSKLIVVYCTCKTEKEARKIADAVVGERLAACATVSKIYSVYKWEGKMQRHPEFEIAIKTLQGAYGELERRMKQLNSYDMPAIIALPVENASAEYEKWVRGSVKVRLSGF